MQLPSLEAIRAEKARRTRARERDRLELSFSAYLQTAWAEVLEPSTPLRWNWHMQVLCDHVQALLEDWMRAQLGILGKLQPVPDGPLPHDEEEREEELRRRSVISTAHREASRLGVLSPDGVSLLTVPQRARNLDVNVPPGSSKTTIILGAAPTWMWTRWPSWRCITLSVNPLLALDWADRSRDLIRSPWYQRTFQPTWTLSESSDAKGFYRNSMGGFRLSSGYFAKMIGGRANALMVDDPDDPDEVLSETLRTKTHTRWDNTLRRRVNDLNVDIRIGIQQRTHPDDWSGHILRSGEWEHLKIKQVAGPNLFCFMDEKGRPALCASCSRGATFLGWKDTREEGALLDPVRFPESALAEDRKQLLIWAAQHQQEPLAAEGRMFKRSAWRFWRYEDEAEPPEALADKCITIPRPERWADLGWEVSDACISADMTFKKTKNGSRVCIGAWVRQGRKRFLLDVKWERMSYTESRRALRELAAAYPWIGPKLIEEKANGAAIIDDLATGGDGQVEVEGLIPVEPDGGKEARAHAISHLQEGGDVYLPLHAIWREAAILECAAFPKQGEPNDFVDQMSQALRRLRAEEFAFV